ncbi:class I SAM-dependent methyltransferase [Litorilituus lipolyticus]|uniref:Class I SAM-dependent methyltransferase n=1 Tax=Litorilituus lipolyticus TaxID=2491017 RepID=A0A502KL88_9GAMM|nr:class I SAM-dependent methyltransferase [Litorilituus lipolyticus]TPH12226.1 class I SAM-dependent methyltransferase [Litorilituus lipolyticus]
MNNEEQVNNNLISVKTFDKLAQKYQDKYMDFRFYHDTYDKLCQYIKPSTAKILDVACGPGNISKYLLSKLPNCQVLGIDMAPKMVELAQQNVPQASFLVMDCRDFSVSPHGYEAVVCGFFTPYLSKPEIVTLIANIRKHIVIGGVLYISTMEGEYNNSGLQTSSAGDQVFIYYHQYPFFEEVLARSGFKVINVKRKTFPVEEGEATTDMFIYAEAI